MASAKLVVTKARGGTKITLVGASGAELLSSKVFTEPRGKGATMRSLKSLLGDEIAVDDQTLDAPTVTVAAHRGSRARVASRPTTAKASRQTARRSRVRSR